MTASHLVRICVIKPMISKSHSSQVPKVGNPAVSQHGSTRAAARARVQPRAVPLRQRPAHPHPVGEHPVRSVS